MYFQVRSTLSTQCLVLRGVASMLEQKPSDVTHTFHERYLLVHTMRRWRARCHQLEAERKETSDELSSRRLLSMAIKVVKQCRQITCFEAMKEEVTRRKIVEAYQLHVMKEYIASANVLWIPYAWIEQSSKLKFISCWKMVSSNRDRPR